MPSKKKIAYNETFVLFGGGRGKKNPNYSSSQKWDIFLWEGWPKLNVLCLIPGKKFIEKRNFQMSSPSIVKNLFGLLLLHIYG